MKLRSSSDHSHGKIKRDLLLIACIWATAVLLLLVRSLITGHTEGSYLLIRVNGKEIGRYSLDEDVRVPVSTKYGNNVLVIRVGEARMEEADCPDGYCMQHRPIRNNGETIVCLPHMLVAETKAERGAKESGPEDGSKEGSRPSDSRPSDSRPEGSKTSDSSQEDSSLTEVDAVAG